MGFLMGFGLGSDVIGIGLEDYWDWVGRLFGWCWDVIDGVGMVLEDYWDVIGGIIEKISGLFCERLDKTGSSWILPPHPANPLKTLNNR